MLKLTRLHYVLAAAITTTFMPALAQQDQGPILRPTRPPSATLLVICDLACTWKLDGKAQGHVEAGGSAKARVELGQHTLEAATDDTLDRVETDITIKSVGQTIYRVGLQSAKDARIRAHQEADPDYLRQHAVEYAKEGQSLYDQRQYNQYPQAMHLLEMACKGGQMPGCITLGDMWEHATVMTYDEPSKAFQNLDRARGFYQKACDNSVMLGCTRLGLIYEFPPYDVWNKDLNKANSLYQKACDGDDMWGCNNLATSYDSGEGVSKDHSRALALYKKSCLGGFAGACENLRKAQ